MKGMHWLRHIRRPPMTLARAAVLKGWEWKLLPRGAEGMRRGAGGCPRPSEKADSEGVRGRFSEEKAGLSGLSCETEQMEM